jgi:predicted Zn-dependent protease with MMP-like domain
MENLLATREMETKYVERLTGKSPRHSRRLINLVKEKLGKLRTHILTISEFCHFFGFDEDKVCRLLGIKL